MKKRVIFVLSPNKNQKHIAKHRVCIYTGFVFNILINYFTDRVTFVFHFLCSFWRWYYYYLSDLFHPLYEFHILFVGLLGNVERSKCSIILLLKCFNAKAVSGWCDLWDENVEVYWAVFRQRAQLLLRLLMKANYIRSNKSSISTSKQHIALDYSKDFQWAQKCWL